MLRSLVSYFPTLASSIYCEYPAFPLMYDVDAANSNFEITTMCHVESKDTLMVLG